MALLSPACFCFFIMIVSWWNLKNHIWDYLEYSILIYIGNMFVYVHIILIFEWMSVHESSISLSSLFVMHKNNWLEVLLLNGVFGYVALYVSIFKKWLHIFCIMLLSMSIFDMMFHLFFFVVLKIQKQQPWWFYIEWRFCRCIFRCFLFQLLFPHLLQDLLRTD